MLENLADFEPHRWFAKLRRKPDNGKNGKEDEGGLAALEAEEGAEEDLPKVERPELAPGWAVEEPLLVIGGRSSLDEAAGAILAAILTKRGLTAKALPPETISAGHIASLAKTEAKLVCLSYLGLGAGPALIRYVVRRLRRILPKGTLILVCYWNEEGNKAATRAMLETAEADAYATSLREAVELCIKAAKGELQPEAGTEAAATAPAPETAPPPEPAASSAIAAKPKREPKRKSQSVGA